MPENVFVIHDLETLKVVADPLHNQILEILIQEPLNVRQVAARLGLAPSKLYYHINLLEKHGLIQVVETRVIANLIEKQYRATAASLDIDEQLLNFTTSQGKESIYSVFTATIDTTREDLLRSLEARELALEQGASPLPRTAMVTRAMARITDQQAAEFLERVKALVCELEQANVENGGADDRQAYALMVAFYPSFYYSDVH